MRLEAELYRVCVRFLTWRGGGQNLPSVRSWRLTHGEGSGPEQNMCTCKGPGRYPICSGVKFHMECIQNHVWVPVGARVMSSFLKTYIYVEVELGDNHG